jgi:hypothetical protein
MNKSFTDFTTFRIKLNVLLKALEFGMDIHLSSGHTLAFSKGDVEGFGFLMTRGSDDIIMQINSDVAWQALINHAKTMGDEEYLKLVADVSLTELKKND